MRPMNTSNDYVQEEEKYPDTPPQPMMDNTCNVAPPQNVPPMVKINTQAVNSSTALNPMYRNPQTNTMQPQQQQQQPMADPMQAMLMQKLMREEQKRMQKQSNRFNLWKLCFSWILLAAAFGSLAFVWFADKPIASGDANGKRFDDAWKGVIPGAKNTRVLKTKWYFTHLKYQKEGHVGGGQTTGYKDGPKTEEIKYDKFTGDNKRIVNYLGMMMKWASIIPLCLLGLAVVLFTLRFCLKSMRYKLTSAAMIFVGLGTMGPMIVIFDIIYTFNSLPIFEKADEPTGGVVGFKFVDTHEYGFKYGMTFWANVSAFCVIIALEIFNVCC